MSATDLSMSSSPSPASTSGSGWTIDTLAAHFEAMRLEKARFDDERDRRYTEVNIEKEKALKIKETADLAALSLARESQTYKEQQNDALRDKNLSESGVYATNSSMAAMGDDIRKSTGDAIAGLAAQTATTLGNFMDEIKPYMTHQNQQQGQQQGSQITKGNIYAGLGAIVGLSVLFAFVAPLLTQ